MNMGYINPLLRLPAGQALQQLPKADRERIEAVMRCLRDQANVEAETAWRRRKAPMAAYWRAVSTYARHIAHSLAARPTDKVMPNSAVQPSADARTMASADVALLLTFIFDRFGRPGDAEYPAEWQYDKAGQPCCTAFVPAGQSTPTPLCPHTMALPLGADTDKKEM